MRYRLVVVMVVGFWVVMMASLVRRWLLEVKPESIPGTYRSVLTPERRNYHSRMAIYLPGQEKKAGYTETVFNYGEDQTYRITNATRVQVPVPGLLEQLAAFGLQTQVVVNRAYALESFSILLASPVLNAKCDGQVEDGELVVRAAIRGEGEQVHRFPLPPGGMVASGLSPLLALPPLRVGLRWTVAVMNPLTFEPTEVELEVLRRETLEWAGEPWDTHVVAIRAGYVEAHAWVARNGEVLKETSIFGVTLVKERVLEEVEGVAKGNGQGPTGKGK